MDMNSSQPNTFIEIIYKDYNIGGDHLRNFISHKTK